jgi:DNA-binding MarR family transcriptional regulator
MYLDSKILDGKVSVKDEVDVMGKMRGQEQDRLGEMLDAWRRVRPETDVEAMAIVPRILRLAYLWDRFVQELTASFDLQRGWLDVLSALRRTGPPHRLPATRLARTILLSSGGMTARIDRMEAAGFIRRLDDPTDRRGVLVELTRKGKDVVEKVIDAQRDHYEPVLSVLTRGERKLFADMLRRQLIVLERRR